jgi:hypothetical protein
VEPLPLPVLLPLAIGGTILATAGLSAVAYMKRVDAITDQARITHGLTFDQANSVGHAFASAEITSTVGANTAKILGDAEEIFMKCSSAWDTYRDLSNNEIGRQVGEYWRQNPNLSQGEIINIIVGLR